MVDVLFGAILFGLPVGLLTYRGVQLCRAGDSFRGMAALGSGLLYLLWLDSSLAYYRASQPLQP